MRREAKRRPAWGAEAARGVSRSEGRDPAEVARQDGRRKNVPDFAAVIAAALAHMPTLCARWLPDGRRQGREWLGRTPCCNVRLPATWKGKGRALNAVSDLRRLHDLPAILRSGSWPVVLVAGEACADATTPMVRLLSVSEPCRA